MKKIVLFFLAITFFISCNKKLDIIEESRISGDRIASIIDDSLLLLGRWKLDTIAVLERNQPGSVTVYDYTLDNIIYEFKPNHILHVTENTDQVDLYTWHKPGTYSYYLHIMIFANNPHTTNCFAINDVPYLLYASANMTKLKIYFTDSVIRFYQLVRTE